MIEQTVQRGSIDWEGGGRTLLRFSVVALFLLIGLGPIAAIAALFACIVWTMRSAVFTWRTGIGLLLLVLMLVPSRIYRLPFATAFDVDPYRLCLVLLVAAWCVAAISHRRFSIRRTYLDVGVGLFMAAIALSYLLNAQNFSAAPEFLTMLKSSAYVASFPLTFYLVATTVSRSEDAIALTNMIMVVAAVTGVLAIYERTTEFSIFLHLNQFVPILEHVVTSNELLPAYRGALRVTGTTAHPIAFATMLSMVFPIALSRMLGAPSRKMRAFSAVCAAMIGAGVFLALSRTGLLGLLTGGAVLFLGFPAHRKRLIIAAIGLTGLVHLFFRGILSSLLEAITPSFVMSQEKGNMNGRLVDYARSLPHIRNHPMFGGGFNTFGPEQFGFIDNQYLKFVLEIGILGVAAYLYLLWRAVTVPFTAGVRASGEKGAILIGFAGAAAVFGATSVTFDTVGFPQITYLFFALCGLSVSIVEECLRG